MIEENIKTKREECGPICEKTVGCTHYTWDTQRGGRCWLKKGPVTKADAFEVSDHLKICGLSALANITGRGIVWQGDWAYACDFRENNLSKS